MWIWEESDWPNFYWNDELIQPIFRKLQLKQGVLLGKVQASNTDEQSALLDSLLANILNSYAIEGEKLNAFSVRSSLAKKLGISERTQYPTSDLTDGIATILFDAVKNSAAPLSTERLFHWHHCLFPQTENSSLSINVGQLRGQELMQVVSGRLARPKVHFQAPPRKGLETEVDRFIQWFNQNKDDPTVHPLCRAAMTHLWFITLHPFDDGNGRITRALTDLALAQAENSSIRFYVMSVTILKKRNGYYDILEQTQKGNGDINEWMN